MSRAAYPRSRVRTALLTAALPSCLRIVPRHHLVSPLGTVPSDSRFCSRTADYTVLYAAPDFITAFVETVLRDRFTRRPDREIALREVTERGWVRIASRPGLALVLLDLRGDGCTRIGAPTDAVHARNHSAGRAFGKAIHAGHPDIDGILYGSRLTGADVYAVFDRGIGKLRTAETGTLADHPELPDVLAEHAVRLVLQR